MTNNNPIIKAMAIYWDSNGIIDISIPIQKGMVVWPKSLEPNFKLVSSHKRGSLWTETEININLHTGTHIDAPLHRIKGGASIDNLPLEIMMGPAAVVYLPKVKAITAKDLDNLDLPKNNVRLLFKTANSEIRQKKFRRNFIGLSSDAAIWIAKRNIRLVGIDYLSVARYSETAAVHQILLKEGVILLEGLNLSGVKPGVYQLICLPLKLVGAEASPVRAILIRSS